MTVSVMSRSRGKAGNLGSSAAACWSGPGRSCHLPEEIGSTPVIEILPAPLVALEAGALVKFLDRFGPDVTGHELDLADLVLRAALGPAEDLEVAPVQVVD